MYQYDRFTGNFIKEWDGTVSIEKELKIPNADISSVCLGKMKTSHNFYFSYEYLGEHLPLSILTWINKNDCCIKIAQYDLNGNFLKLFNSVSEASNFVSKDKNYISRVNLNAKISLGYIWKRVLDNENYTQALSQEEIVNKSNSLINNKPCCMYDLNGKFIRRFVSTTEASVIMNLNQSSIASVCRGNYKKCGNYYWKYECDNYGADLSVEYVDLLSTHGLSKEVYQFDLNGELIRKYKSITLASKDNNLSTTNIFRCCNRKLKQTGGYIWRYFQDDINQTDIINLLNNKHNKKVAQYDKDMNYIQTFSTLAEAEKLTGTNVSSIIQCCKGNYKKANGYKWKYIVD